MESGEWKEESGEWKEESREWKEEEYYEHMINKLYPPRNMAEKKEEPEFVVAAAPEPEPAKVDEKVEDAIEEKTEVTAPVVRKEEKPSTLSRMKNWLNRMISEED